jgi:hypothetical protein
VSVVEGGRTEEVVAWLWERGRQSTALSVTRLGGRCEAYLVFAGDVKQCVE